MTLADTLKEAPAEQSERSDTENYLIARYHFSATMQVAHRLPFYSGSALRGIFGHALRRVACMTAMKHCNECPLKETCPYTEVFEPAAKANTAIKGYTQRPALYIIEPPAPGEKYLQAGDNLEFSMVLIGPAMKQLPLIVLAWQQALQRGLGKGRHAATLRSVAVERDVDNEKIPQIIWRSETPCIIEHPQQLQIMKHTMQALTLNIHTPMRLQRQSKPIGPDKINPLDLLGPLLRRVELVRHVTQLAPLYTDMRAHMDNARHIKSHATLRWTDWERYSNRQQQKMALGGITGQWALQGNLQPYQHALQLGQWLHIGKNTTFGMGAYTISATS